MPKVDPEILAALDEERGAMASSGRNFRTFKLKAGESALVRFLPVEMGPKKTWFARIARHWVNKHPILCQRQTSPHFNGDPTVVCPLCDIEAEFSQSPRKEVQEAARMMGAFPKILTYLFVFEITNERGHKMPTSATELYIPNDYWVSKEGWKELDHLWRKSIERNPPFGFLDPVSGYDFTITRDQRNGYRHIREDPAPIEKGKSVDDMLDIIDKAFAKVKKVDTTPATDEEMDAHVEKAREILESLDIRSTRGSRRGESAVDRNSDEVSPRSRRESSSESENYDAPRSRRGAESDAAAASEPSNDEPAPRSRRGAPADEAPPEPPARTSRGAPAESTRRGAEPENQGRGAPGPTGRRGVPAGIDESELDEVNPPAATGAEDEAPPPVRGGGTATPSRRTAPPPPARSRIDDDPEQMPREKHDAAPPEPAAAAEAAPARSTRATENQRALSEGMQSRINRLGRAQL